VRDVRGLVRLVFLALGVPGNVLSAIVWLRRYALGKNSSSIYLSKLAVNDLAYLLGVFFANAMSCFGTKRGCDLIEYTDDVATLLQPLLVLGFSVKRLVVILRPLQVRYR